MSTSVEASASTSAGGFIWLTSGSATATAPTPAKLTAAMLMKSRRRRLSSASTVAALVSSSVAMLTLKTEISSLPNGNGYEPTTQPGWGAVGGPDSASPRSCKCQNAVQMPVLCDEAVRDYRRRMRICLFEPEIAGNVGAIMRLGACMGIAVDLIEPLGFRWDDKRVRRTAMDYIDHVEVVRHSSFASFRSKTPGRLILFSTKGANSPYDFAFMEDDILL